MNTPALSHTSANRASPQRSRQELRDALLTQVDESHRTFFSAVFDALTGNLTLTPEGIAWLGNGKREPVPFCSAFRAKALTRREDGTGWSTVVELLNPDKQLVECVLPWKLRDGKPREAIAFLAEHGLLLRDDYELQTVLKLLRNWPVLARQCEVGNSGWTTDKSAFVLPSGRILSQAGKGDEFRYIGAIDAREKGDLTTWQKGVSALCVGNPNLLFACSLAFSAPLLSLFPSSASAIYHFYGPSSRGKTRIMRAALSVWPRVGSGDKTWRATINGLEGEAAQANNLLLGLDDLPEDPPADFSKAIYMIGNDGGKARADKEGGAVRRQTWKTAVLSTGEVASAVSLTTIGKTPRGGQGVRMVDIPVEGITGAFDALHDHPTGAAFVAALDQAVDASAGPAGAAFVQWLLQKGIEHLEQQLPAQTQTVAAALLKALGIAEEDQTSNEVRRVIDGFALIAVAGEWSTAAGITGWPRKAAFDAVLEVARRWLVARGSRMPRDQAEAIEKTRDYLSRHGMGLEVLPLRAEANHLTDIRGYRDDEFYYLLRETFAEIHSGRTPDTIAAFLEEAGFLARGGERSSLQYRMSGIGKSRPRVYRIRSTILDT